MNDGIKTDLQPAWTGITERCGAYGVFLCAFALYLLNLAPQVIWGDSAKLCILSYTHTIGASPSMHSLHAVIGNLFGHLPFGGYAYRLNLMSAFWGAAAVTVVYAIVKEATGSGFAALAAAVSLTVSHTMFLLSVITETYTLYAFFLSLTMYLTLKWDREGNPWHLYLACFFFCMGLAAHPLIIMSALGLLYCVLASDRRSSIGTGQALRLSAALLLGLSPIMVFAAYTLHAQGFRGLAWVLANDPANSWVSLKAPVDLLKGAGKYLAMLMYQFPVAGFCLGAAGSALSYRGDRKLFRTLLLIFLCNVVFVLHYGEAKQYSLSLGSYLMFSIWIGVGAAWFLRYAAGRAGTAIKAAVLAVPAILPPVFYGRMPVFVDKLGIDLVHARFIPYRDNDKFFLVPWKRNDKGPLLYADEVFRIAGPGSIIVVDYTVMKVLEYYMKVEGKGAGRNLVFVDYPFRKLDVGIVDENISKVPVYIASQEFEEDYSLAELRKKYVLEARGPLYEVKAKN